MNPVVAKVLKKTLTTSATVVGALFVVYFWNLDQKLMGWLYKQVNTCSTASPPTSSSERIQTGTAASVLEAAVFAAFKDICP